MPVPCGAFHARRRWIVHDAALAAGLQYAVGGRVRRNVATAAGALYRVRFARRSKTHRQLTCARAHAQAAGDIVSQARAAEQGAACSLMRTAPAAAGAPAAEAPRGAAARPASLDALRRELAAAERRYARRCSR
jgi:hypothetical protein